MEPAVPSDEDESGEALLTALVARLMCFVGSTGYERLVRHRANGDSGLGVKIQKSIDQSINPIE
jgi:hypothetical protein